jgi:hypothetical protein
MVVSSKQVWLSSIALPAGQARQHKMKRMNRRLALISIAMAAAVVASLLTGYRVWEEAALHQPQFDLLVEVDAPKRLGCFEAYINADYKNPARACLDHDGSSTLVLANVPARVSTIRFDTGDEKDVEFTLKALKFVTSKFYLPLPRSLLHEFKASDVAAWTPQDVSLDGATGLARTASRDPQFHARLDLDLPAALGTSPQSASFLDYVSKPLLALLVLELVVTMLLGVAIVRAYPRAEPVERDRVWIAALSFLGFLATVITAYPGHTNYDELFSLSEYWNGVLSDVQPPLQTIAWSALIDFGRGLGLNPLRQAAVMLFAQAALFWSAAAILASLIHTRLLARGFLLVLAVSPISLVVLGHIGKDTQLAIALFVSITLLALAIKRRSLAILALTILPMFYAFAVRSNAPAAVLPLCFIWTIVALRIRRLEFRRIHSGVAITAASLALFVALLGASRTLSQIVVKNRCCFGEQAFMPINYDLMGISLRVDKNLIPPEFREPGYDLNEIKKRYDPFSLDFNGLKRITPDHYMLVITTWLQALRDYPAAVILQRLDVFANLLGLHSGPSHAPYMSQFYIGSGGFQLPDRARQIVGFYENQSPQYFRLREWSENYFAMSAGWPVYKLWTYFAFFAFLLLFRTGTPLSRFNPVVWFSLSALFYTIPYLPLTNSAQFRYVYWAALALFCACVLRLDAILQYQGLATTRGAEPSERPSHAISAQNVETF